MSKGFSRDLFIKLLNLTQSSEDAEALNAIHRANTLLRSVDLGWEDIIKKKKAEPEAVQNMDKQYDIFMAAVRRRREEVFADNMSREMDRRIFEQF